MNKIRLLFLLLTTFLVSTLNAQINTNELHPLPQKITDHNRQLSLDATWRLDNKAAVSQSGLSGFEKLFSISKSGKLTLEFRKIGKKSSLYQIDGAYVLKITDKGICIEANADNGYFYALQTLKQMLYTEPGKLSLPVCEIEDYPNVQFRGTVEGFYGEPWTHADRIEQLKFYGKLKLNTYIYGPKDDPYHSSPNWRQPYPEKEAAQIRDLVETACENHVNFVWAVHPGKDIQWNRADSVALTDKFEAMYQLGVRHFAVFFDDISGAGVNAEKQAALMNYIQTAFLEKKKDVTPLIMCPTEYNKAWSNPDPGTYLDILGDNLHPNVQVMWTGNTVVADITREGLEWVNKRIRRNAYVWWNFPVSDYVRDHLLLGPSYGLDKDGASHMSGFVSNPMDKAEPSKVAIFSVGEYAWNMDAYDPQKSWKAACRYVMHEAPDAFLCFAAHNSDPGHNWHRYRRDESVDVKNVVNRYVATLEQGGQPTESAELVALFDSVSAAPSIIRAKSNNKRLIEQMDPWLTQFELLGKTGVKSLAMTEAFVNGDLDAAWTLYTENLPLLNQMEWNDLNVNQNPFQPGVKTGSLVLFPFVKRLNSWVESGLLKSIARESGGEKVQKSVSSAPGVYTSLPALRNQSIAERKLYLTVTPILEVIQLKPDDYVGLSWGLDRRVTEISFNMGNKELADLCKFEISKDGNEWEDLTVENKSNQFQAKNIPAGTCLFRIKSKSENPVAVRLNELKAKTEKPDDFSAEYYAGDANLASSLPLEAGSEVKFVNDKTSGSNGVNLFLSGLAGNVIVKGTARDGKGKTLFAGRAGTIRIDEKDLADIAVYTDEGVNIHEVMWR